MASGISVLTSTPSIAPSTPAAAETPVGEAVVVKEGEAAVSTPQEIESKAEQKEITESRKMWLQASKAKRNADELMKKSRDTATKAEKFQAALNSDDPTTMLIEAGLDPNEYYRKLTTYALNQGKKEVKDPVQERLALAEKKLQAYEDAQNQQALSVAKQKEVNEEVAVITQEVLTIFNQPEADYEVLTAIKGDKNNAACYVYDTVKKIFQETGEIKSFKQVADELEKWHQEQIDAGIISASKLKRFSNRFNSTPVENSSDETKIDQNDKLFRSKMMSAKRSVSNVADTSNTKHVPANTPRLSRADRLKKVLSK
jgi:hypothetical protein